MAPSRVPYERVRHLASAFFHQDYREDARSAIGVLDGFRTDKAATTSPPLVIDIGALLTSTLTEAEVRYLC